MLALAPRARSQLEVFRTPIGIYALGFKAAHLPNGTPPCRKMLRVAPQEARAVPRNEVISSWSRAGDVGLRVATSGRNLALRPAAITPPGMQSHKNARALNTHSKRTPGSAGCEQNSDANTQTSRGEVKVRES